jgi:hypothetical protein
MSSVTRALPTGVPSAWKLPILIRRPQHVVSSAACVCVVVARMVLTSFVRPQGYVEVNARSSTQIPSGSLASFDAHEVWRQFVAR